MATTTANPSNSFANRQESRDRLLLAALPHIAFDGWTDKAFLAGIANCGMETSDFRRFFPGGACDAIDPIVEPELDGTPGFGLISALAMLALAAFTRRD